MLVNYLVTYRFWLYYWKVTGHGVWVSSKASCYARDLTGSRPVYTRCYMQYFGNTRREYDVIDVIFSLFAISSALVIKC
jgi:hypothetical protein